MKKLSCFYSPLFRPLFSIAMGLLYALAIAGARFWAQDLGLQMNIWKWLVLVLWYGGLSLGLAASFTLIGERSPKAGGRLLAIVAILAAITGAGLACWLA